MTSSSTARRSETIRCALPPPLGTDAENVTGGKMKQHDEDRKVVSNKVGEQEAVRPPPSSWWAHGNEREQEVYIRELVDHGLRTLLPSDGELSYHAFMALVLKGARSRAKEEFVMWLAFDKRSAHGAVLLPSRISDTLRAREDVQIEQERGGGREMVRWKR